MFSNLSKTGLKELRFVFCVDGAGSKGLRDFVRTNYSSLKAENADLPILVRYGKGTEARILAR